MSERDGFLARWSRRKREVAAGRVPEEAPPSAPTPEASSAHADAAQDAQPVAVAPLPPVESLTPESDFSPFMAREVDPELRRAALKTLFRDERFNVMDGLDVYIDDYTKPAPIPPEWYGRMAQLAGLGDVPAREAAEARAREALSAPQDEKPQISGIDGTAPLPSASGTEPPVAPTRDDHCENGPTEHETGPRQ